MENTLKFCKDCKYFKHYLNQGTVCTSPQLPIFKEQDWSRETPYISTTMPKIHADLVTGTLLYPQAVIVRADPGTCGVEAKWIAPIEEQKTINLGGPISVSPIATHESRKLTILEYLKALFK